jgi:hypothetical protein
MSHEQHSPKQKHSKSDIYRVKTIGSYYRADGKFIESHIRRDSKSHINDDTFKDLKHVRGIGNK